MDALLAARSQEKLTPTAAEHVKLVAAARKASDTRMAQQKAMLKAEVAECERALDAGKRALGARNAEHASSLRKLEAELARIKRNNANMKWANLALRRQLAQAGATEEELRSADAARASPYVSDGRVRVGGFHPGHDAYRGGEYLADNIASWALVGLLVQAHGRHLV